MPLCIYGKKNVKDVKPMSFEDVIGDAKWDKAMDKEIDALDINETWDLVSF